MALAASKWVRHLNWRCRSLQGMYRLTPRSCTERIGRTSCLQRSHNRTEMHDMTIWLVLRMTVTVTVTVRVS